jgi:hypothetical protein
MRINSSEIGHSREGDMTRDRISHRSSPARPTAWIVTVMATSALALRIIANMMDVPE